MQKKNGGKTLKIKRILKNIFVRALKKKNKTFRFRFPGITFKMNFERHFAFFHEGFDLFLKNR